MTDEAKALVERAVNETRKIVEEEYTKVMAAMTQSQIETASKAIKERDAIIETQARENERLNAVLSTMNDTDVIARTMAENERLKAALTVLRDLPIVENDNPDTLHVDGVAYTGPAVDFLFRVVRKIKTVARAALAGDSHDQ